MRGSTGGRGLLFAFGVVALPIACTSGDGGDRFSRHFDAGPWTSAVEQNVSEPREWVPEATLLLATPLLHPYDDELSEHAQSSHAITGSATTSGDTVMAALAVGSAGLAGWNWIEGDHAESFEVAAESFAMTGLETSILKRAVARPRPNHGTPDSFPSGHASFSFAAATFLARSAWDAPEPSWTSELLGWSAYLPAAFVGLNRVEAGRHFPSDVTFGAALGIITTNLFWDAHFGKPAGSGESERIFAREPDVHASLLPMIGSDSVGLDLQIRF